MSMTAAYFAPSGHRDPMQWTPEASRRARGVELWTALRTLGREGVADLVDRTCRYASAAAFHGERAGFEVLNDVVLKSDSRRSCRLKDSGSFRFLPLDRSRNVDELLAHPLVSWA
jgi:glutamate/tyrosine decarboxylase-like PLP-dependent enzyme